LFGKNFHNLKKLDVCIIKHKYKNSGINNNNIGLILSHQSEVLNLDAKKNSIEALTYNNEKGLLGNMNAK